MCLPCWEKANPRRVKNSRPATDVKDDETAALLVSALSTTTIHDDSPSEDAPSTFIGAISDVSRIVGKSKSLVSTYYSSSLDN